MNILYDQKELYKAHLSRDNRFDGKFFVAVKTTRIYCRPICPARKAKLKNLQFYRYAVQAESAGYRPCLRCRPESAPGSDDWLGTNAFIRRTLRWMESSHLEDITIKSVAEKLGITERWLSKIFKEQVGASPKAMLLIKKLDIARNLLASSNLSITDIAFSSGFNSVRAFNTAFKNRFQTVPSKLRRSHHSLKEQCIYLRYRPPYAWHKMLDFFDKRAIPSIELVIDNTYQRLLSYGETYGWMKISHADDNQIKVEFAFDRKVDILDFITRVKAMLDLDADPMQIENDLKQDQQFKPFVEKNSGMRIFGGWDGFEIAVRAIIGQLISIKAARTILGRLVDLCGQTQSINMEIPLKKYFPSPEDILNADISGIGLSKSKETAIKTLATAIVEKKINLNGIDDYDQTRERLLAIKGIGKWTVEYIALRCFKDPNAYPETDLELIKRMRQYQFDPNKWIPWRGYGAALLFSLQPEDYL